MVGSFAFGCIYVCYYSLALKTGKVAGLPTP